MELKDTVDMMTSDDYKERFKAEYWQLRIRKEKLSQMLIDWGAGQLDFKPRCPKEVLERQLHLMYMYQEVLEGRAVIERIEISESVTR